MLAVVTGAEGFLGCNLVRELLGRGIPTRAMVFAGTEAIDGLDLEVVRGDVLDSASLESAFDGAELIFHCAAVVSIAGNQGGLVERINIGGVRNVVRAAMARSVKRLVHVSSVHSLVPDPDDEPIDEGRALVHGTQHSAYALSKAAGEREVLAGVEAGLDAVIVNPSGLFGPNDFGPSLFGRTLLWLRQGKLPALIDGAYNFVDARDVATSAVDASERGRRGERYLLGGHVSSVLDLSNAVAELTGGRGARLAVPRWVALATAPAVEWLSARIGVEPIYTSEAVRILGDNPRISLEKSRAELGHDPRPMQETIRDTIAFFESAGMV
ncbi:MAG: NAD-dependent epimerase [Gemmatimonadetes bacterium]|nr:NAD-dependent epimerase [Gemmatimonadota bacterium]